VSAVMEKVVDQAAVGPKSDWKLIELAFFFKLM
jgi:hypothetical protein